ICYAPVIGNGHTKFHRFLPDMAAKRLQGSAALISRSTWYHFSTAEANTGDSAMSWRIVLPSGPYNPLTERGDQAMSAITTIAHGLRFPEGPIAMLDGAVVLVEIERQTLSRVHPNGEVSVVATLGGGPNGAAIGPDGRCYVCNNGGFEGPGRGGVWVAALETGPVETLYTPSDQGPLRGPNDLVFDAHGGFWFTDFGKTRRYDMDRGSVCYARADGSVFRQVIPALVTPNGVGLSPGGARLFVA